VLTLDVPGYRVLTLAHLVLDVNGTLAFDGELLPGVVDQLATLRQQLTLHLLTADTHGRQHAIDATLGLTAVRMRPGTSEAQQKADYVGQLGSQQVVAIGNGANDALMLREAAVGIAVLGGEGVALVAAQGADVLVGSISVGLGLLLAPRRLAATLRR
jgi:P-type E1-E2 ATPase